MLAVPVHLTLLGGFALSVGGAAAPTLPRKTRALLTLLALQRGRAMEREAVGECLWPDRGAEQVRHSLRQALTELRRLLAPHDLVTARAGLLSLAPAVEVDAAPHHARRRNLLSPDAATTPPDRPRHSGRAAPARRR